MTKANFFMIKAPCPHVAQPFKACATCQSHVISEISRERTARGGPLHRPEASQFNGLPSLCGRPWGSWLHQAGVALESRRYSKFSLRSAHLVGDSVSVAEDRDPWATPHTRPPLRRCPTPQIW